MNRFMPPAATVSASAPGGAGSVAALLCYGLTTSDDQQRVVTVNAAASHLFGCPAAQMTGRDRSRSIPPGPRAARAQQVQQFLQSDVVERPALPRKTMIGLRTNGEEFLAEATITRMATADSLGAQRLGTAPLHDLSALRNRMALTERTRSIIDLAPLAVWITDGDRIVYANRASATLFGATDPQGLRGQSIYPLLGPKSPAAVRQGLSLALGTDAAVPVINEPIARLDGQARGVEIAVAALPDHGTTDQRPPMLDDPGLNPAIDWLANGWARRTGLSVSPTPGPNDPPIGEFASIALYRILQAALTNVVRHSKPSQVRVAPRSGGEAVVLMAEDDGIGLPAQAVDQPGSHGPLGMRERCQVLGGQFELGNSPGGALDVAQGAHLARGSTAPDAESSAHEAGRPGSERVDGMAGLRRGPTVPYLHLHLHVHLRPLPHPHRHRRVQADHSHPSAPASRASAAVRGTKAIR